MCRSADLRGPSVFRSGIRLMSKAPISRAPISALADRIDVAGGRMLLRLFGERAEQLSLMRTQFGHSIFLGRFGHLL